MLLRNCQSTLMASGAALAIVAYATPAVAQTRTFNVPAQAAARGIPAFAKQAGVQILARGELVRAKRTNRVAGRYSTEDGLNLLLRGTGLKAGAPDATGIIVIQRDDQGSVPGARSSRDDSERAPTDLANRQSDDLGEEIVVTGTNIRGVVNPTQPLSSHSREEIARSGRTSVQDYLNTIPQNFKGSYTQEGIAAPPSQLSARGALGHERSINLRGLGEGASLTLVNGHRLPPTGRGYAFNIGQIPLEAVDRIDVLTDGASAIYGADAIGGVVNLVLRRDYEGFGTKVDVGTDTRGDRQTINASQTVGTSWQSGSVLGIAHYGYSDKLSAVERSRSATSNALNVLYPASRQFGTLVSAQQSIGDQFDVSAEATYTKGRVARASYVSSSSITDSSVASEAFSAGGGFNWNVHGDWSVSGSGLYARSKDESSIYLVPPTPNSSGRPDRTAKSGWQNSYHSANLKADGTIFELPGGKIKGAFGGEYRAEKFSSTSNNSNARPVAYRRNVEALFGEIYLPVISERNALPLVNELAVSAAVRRDEYSDLGSTTNPKFGLLWSPIKGLNLRTSWGTSFRPPVPYESNQTGTGAGARSFALLYPGIFPHPDGSNRPVFLITNDKIPLRPERAKSLTIGLDYEPEFADGLRLSLNYYNIRYTDKIITPPFDATALIDTARFGNLVTAYASGADAVAAINKFISDGGRVDNPFGASLSDVRFAYSLALVNAAKVLTSGYDFDISYDRPMGDGTLMLSVAGTIIEKIDAALCATCQPIDLANRAGEALKFKARGNIGWASKAFTVQASVNHANAYRDFRSLPIARVKAFTTADLVMRYSPQGLGKINLGLSILNIFDKSPPFALNPYRTGVNYDPSNADILGRSVTLSLGINW